MDLPRFLKDYAESKGMVFAYGDLDHLNLVYNQNEQENTNVPIEDVVKKDYLMCEPPVRRIARSKVGNALSAWRYTGAISIVTPSGMDEQYFNESPVLPDSDSRYTKYIEPKMPIAQDLADALECNGFDVEDFSIVDVVQFLDENRDGIIIRYGLYYE